MRTHSAVIGLIALAGTSQALNLQAATQVTKGTHDKHAKAFKAACEGDLAGEFPGAVTTLGGIAETIGMSASELC